MSRIKYPYCYDYACDELAKISIGKQTDFKDGLNKVSIEGMDDIVVAKIDGKFYAMRGICNHQGGPLAEGTLEANVITCPWHGAKWDVTTGKLVEFPMELDEEPTYQISTEGDELFIDA